METLILFLGVIIAIAFTIFIENLRKSKLQIINISFIDKEYTNKYPAQNARFLVVEIQNKPLPKFVKWMSRNPALHCHGYVSFHYMDGQNIFGRNMQLKWSDQPLPTTLWIQTNNEKIGISNFQSSFNTIDAFVGEKYKLDVAAKFDEDSECYGWTYENEFSDPLWRNKNWKLKEGQYLVHITIISSGEKCEEIFRLINSIQRTDFRLENRQSQDNVF